MSRECLGPAYGVSLSGSPLARTAAAGAATFVLLAGPELLPPAERPTAPGVAAEVVADLLELRARPAAASRAAQRLPEVQVRAQTAASRRSAVVAFVQAQQGDRYLFGASGPSAWDCSGLTMRGMARAGIRLPHSSRAQGRRGVRVPSRDARPGDLIFWPSGHVAVLTGRWRMVDAPGRGRRVQERAVYRSGSPQFRRLIG